MKRKFKLITSVASLCLAVALMAFGVYAATAPTVTVNGSVSFTASNVLASYKVEQDPARTAEAAAAWATKGEGSFTTTTETANANPTVTLDELKLDDVKLTASYRMTITSDFAAGSSAKVIVKVTTAPAEVNENGITEHVEYSKTAIAEGVNAGGYELAAGEELVITYTITINPAVASTFGAGARNFVLALTRA